MRYLSIMSADSARGSMPSIADHREAPGLARLEAGVHLDLAGAVFSAFAQRSVR